MNNYNNYNNYALQYANQQKPSMVQLSEEEIKILENSRKDDFSIKLSKIDQIRSKCPHRRNGEYTLHANNDGSHTCTICGETFELVDLTKEEVEIKVNELIDILQSVKTFYMDIPTNILNDYMLIIEMLKKTPKLYEFAVENFQRYDVGIHNNRHVGNNGFAALGNILGGGMGFPNMPMNNPGGMNNGMMMGQQYGGMPMGQQYGGMPMGQQYGGMPMGQQNNAFYQNNGGDPTRQMNTGYMPQQNQAPQAPTPQAPAPQADTPTSTKQFNE